MIRRAAIVSALVLIACVAVRTAETDRDRFVSVQAPQVALEHVDVIDGSGGAIRRDQTVILTGDQISAVGAAAAITAPSSTRRLDLRGHTVIPGIVGMHNHLFYAADGGQRYVSEAQGFARLYLAAGVTSIRTAGSIDPAHDAAIKRRIDAGLEPGPRIYWSGVYLDGTRSASEWTALIDQAAAAGVTSLKAYTGVRRPDLAAIIDAGHRRGMVVTGHLCEVGFREAAALGIDNLEHGLFVDSDLDPRKDPNRCPQQVDTILALARLDPDAPAIRTLIRELVTHGVAITSTLAVYESFTSGGAFVDPRVERFLAEPALDAYRVTVSDRARGEEFKSWEAALANEMAFERRFVEAGGLLVAGADPTAWGGTLAGLADQRNVELLAKAGFTPEQVIQIVTSNGASLLRSPAASGLVQKGKTADLVVLEGDLAGDIRAIRNVRFVFVGGVGFSPEALSASELGRIGAKALTWRDRKWLIAAAAALVTVLAVALYDRHAAGQKRKRLAHTRQ